MTTLSPRMLIVVALLPGCDRPSTPAPVIKSSETVSTAPTPPPSRSVALPTALPEAAPRQDGIAISRSEWVGHA